MAYISPTHQPSCIPHVLAQWAAQAPDALAILAPGRPPLTYSRLWRHVADVVQTLRALGLRRHDRVALILPNGPEMAVACLAVAAGTICVPLNPAYSTNEFSFYLTDLQVQALVLQTGIDSPARAVAHAYGCQIIELQPKHEAEAGLFTLTGAGSLHTATAAYAPAR